MELPKEEIERKQMHFATNLLKEKGYHHYEISNFAQPGMEAVHNSSYWKRIPYIGLGLGAASFWGNQRWRNTLSLQEYLQKAGKKDIRKEIETLTPLEEVSEALILGLRFVDGIDLEK